jgi:hypothetical protein
MMLVLQPKRKLLTPYNRFLPSLKLIHIPIRPNKLPIQELGLVARSPHHEMRRKADYKEKRQQDNNPMSMSTMHLPSS